MLDETPVDLVDDNDDDLTKVSDAALNDLFADGTGAIFDDKLVSDSEDELEIDDEPSSPPVNNRASVVNAERTEDEIARTRKFWLHPYWPVGSVRLA